MLCEKRTESGSARSRNRLTRHSICSAARRKAVGQSNGNGSANGQPRLRDRLCLLIRKYQLDPGLVKRYAADFCGTEYSATPAVTSSRLSFPPWPRKPQEIVRPSLQVEQL